MRPPRRARKRAACAISTSSSCIQLRVLGRSRATAACTSCAVRSGRPGVQGTQQGFGVCPPPYKVYSSDFTEVGEVATAEEAVALLVRHLPPDLRRP
ncbi:hypothetical protein ABTY98_32605 [Streptomyces sp. NPDC096040]|uniref:hypothetical protein n=1 Tax=Streptomyces sp. NPDC096040 TaxID=3155541 RepID=UPI0033303D37